MATEHALSTSYELEVPSRLLVPDDADGSLLVALHGMGMSPTSFEEDVGHAVPDGMSLLLPQGPLPFEVRKTGDSGLRIDQGNAWYIYVGETDPFLEWMARTAEWLMRVIDDAVVTAGLDASRVHLLGFSQGGYFAGWLGLRRPDRFRSLVVAGARIKAEVLLDEARAIAADHPDFRAFCVHGADDRSVTADMARESVDKLTAHGVPMEFRTYPWRHRVLRNADCAADVRAFLAS